MIGHERGHRDGWDAGYGKSLTASGSRIPTRVSARRDFMITKDPHATALKTLRQKQCLRDHGDAAGVICMLNPEYQDFIPVASAFASAPAGPTRGRTLAVQAVVRQSWT